MAKQAMAACLGRLGFNAETNAYIRSHGVATAQYFRAISLSTMDDDDGRNARTSPSGR
jgi:hypothetical protein